jgi:hypothetical protein
MFSKDNYLFPVTIGIISLNCQIPIGLKVQTYDPITLKTMGFFINVIPSQW